jgi:hypothetical protein
MARLPNRGDIARRVAQHLLPRTRSPNVWGGPGSGLRCDGCGHPIESDEIEYEFCEESATTRARSSGCIFNCYEVWAAELDNKPPPTNP